MKGEWKRRPGNSFWNCVCHVRTVVKHHIGKVFNEGRHVTQFVLESYLWDRVDEGKPKAGGKWCRGWKRISSTRAYSGLLTPGLHSVSLLRICGFCFQKVFMHDFFFQCGYFLRGSRICNPRMCHLVMWIILNKRQSGGASYLPLNGLKEFR